MHVMVLSSYEDAGNLPHSRTYSRASLVVAGHQTSGAYCNAGKTFFIYPALRPNDEVHKPHISPSAVSAQKAEGHKHKTKQRKLIKRP